MRNSIIPTMPHVPHVLLLLFCIRNHNRMLPYCQKRIQLDLNNNNNNNNDSKKFPLVT